MRYNVNEKLALGVNAFLEREDIAQDSTNIEVDPANPDNNVTVYNDYQEEENKGALVSARYKLTDKWELTVSHNYEEYEKWEINNNEYGSDETEWGDDRTWQTIGINYKPSRSVIFAYEQNFGESAQNAYAYARVYF